MGIAPRIAGGAGKLQLLDTYTAHSSQPYTYTFAEDLSVSLIAITLTRDNIIPGIKGDVTLNGTALERIGEVSNKDNYAAVHTYAYKCNGAKTGNVLTVPHDSGSATNITIMFFGKAKITTPAISVPTGYKYAFLPYIEKLRNELAFSSANSATTLEYVFSTGDGFTLNGPCMKMTVPIARNSWSCLYQKFNFTNVNKIFVSLVQSGYQFKAGISASVPVATSSGYPSFSNGISANTWVDVSSLTGEQYIGLCQAGPTGDNKQGIIQLYGIYYM